MLQKMLKIILHKKREFVSICLFPAVFIYFELFLRIFGKTGIWAHLIYPILFGAGAGFFFALTATAFTEKVNRIVTMMFLSLFGVLFIVECLIHRSMQFYMPLGAIGSVAGDVAGDYMQQLVKAVITSVPIIVVFLLPAVLYFILDKKYSLTMRHNWKMLVLLLTGSILFTGLGVWCAGSGSTGAKYKSQYKFDTAAEYFGLISSLELDFVYGLFGNDAADALIISPTDFAEFSMMQESVSEEQASGYTDAAGEYSLLGDKSGVNGNNPAAKKTKVLLGEEALSKEVERQNEGESVSGVTLFDDSDLAKGSELYAQEPDETGDADSTGQNRDNDKDSKPAEVVVTYGKNEMDLPLDELSASVSDETIISMNEYVKALPASSQNPYTGIFAGKNLILICAEAFSHEAVDPELTPTLYRLTHNGFYFSDYYQPSWNGSTSTGEYSMLMGIAPLKDIRTMPATEGHNLYFTLGNQLQRIGYTGNAFHNGGYEYYSRHLTHENLGYDKYVALGSGLEDLSGWWPPDSKMFEATIPTYIDQQPFSVYYMTGSGHFPYEANNVKTAQYIDYVRGIAGDRYKDKTLYYLCYQMELEKSLAILVQQLEEKGIANDTVICITADHYPYGLEKSSTYGNREDYIEDLYGYNPQQEWEQDKNGWILWSGSLENEHKELVCEISDPTYSLDIAPTLSNLFGLTYDSRLFVGRDVFSDAQPLVLWTDHSWVTKEGQYDADTDTFFPNEGVLVSEYYIEQMKMIVANKLSFSGKILDYDYYDLLFGSAD